MKFLLKSYSYEKNYVETTIKRYSGSKDTAGIKAFVENAFKNERNRTFFINSKSWDLIELIENGIIKFRQAAEEKQAMKKNDEV
jgi:hypothetical protein